MTSPVDLVNQALDQIPARTSITGLSPPTPPNNVAAQAASRLYQTQVDAVFRAAHWNSARFQAQLTLLKAAIGTPENPSGAMAQPPMPWRYEYAYPSDCLKVRFVFPPPNIVISGSAPLMTNMGASYSPLIKTSLPFVPAIDTDASGNKVKVILTNACMAQCVYTARIDNPDLWDASLQNAVIGALAAWLVPAISGDDKKVGMRTQLAVALINAARVSDGNEGITSVDHIPDWMQARDTGNGFWGWNCDGQGFMSGWDGWGGPDGVSY